MAVFTLQQFSVSQDRSAMKVCTDSLVFGAMAPVKPGIRVLDIGCGNGLLSLIAAQLGANAVCAVEIEPGAYLDAASNFSRSPWPDKLTAVQADIRIFAADHGQRYDLIISNPPFFQNQLSSRDLAKSLAWHADSLSCAELTSIAHRLLKPDGRFYVLVAAASMQTWLLGARQAGFHAGKQTGLRGFAHVEPSVYALTFSLKPEPTLHERLTVFAAPGVYSPHSRRYLEDFLPRFAADNQAQQ
ncbi:MAG: ribose-phosphate pyrophosphokinase [Methylobacter sp.]|nr:MAG: ribose-phosphate pyrophosphokinase [Methylobacter sp.]PPD19382.1 MAG: ribose-phosphate pyrophosphokinase [Methylobacter sp.]